MWQPEPRCTLTAEAINFLAAIIKRPAGRRQTFAWRQIGRPGRCLTSPRHAESGSLSTPGRIACSRKGSKGVARSRQVSLSKQVQT